MAARVRIVILAIVIFWLCLAVVVPGCGLLPSPRGTGEGPAVVVGERKSARFDMRLDAASTRGTTEPLNGVSLTSDNVHWTDSVCSGEVWVNNESTGSAMYDVQARIITASGVQYDDSHWNYSNIANGASSLSRTWEFTRAEGPGNFTFTVEVSWWVLSSPTNQKIVFTSWVGSNTCIFQINPDGSGLTQLTQGASDWCPRWSPDGQKIAFERSLDIYLMDVGVLTPTPLTSGSRQDKCPSWYPTGGTLAYASGGGSPYYDIYQISLAAPTPIPLTSGAQDNSWPNWSPDGAHIVFQSKRDGDYEIYVMNTRPPGTPTPLTSNSVADECPSYSPDGSMIVYTSGSDRSREIYAIHLDDISHPHRLTNNAANDAEPAWSPDGTQIVFVSDQQSQGDMRLYTMKSGGSAPTPIPNAPSGDCYQPHWWGQWAGVPTPTPH